MNELVERVLAIGAGLPKDDLPRLKGKRVPINGHPLAQGLHGHLSAIICDMFKLSRQEADM